MVNFDTCSMNVLDNVLDIHLNGCQRLTLIGYLSKYGLDSIAINISLITVYLSLITASIGTGVFFLFKKLSKKNVKS